MFYWTKVPITLSEQNLLCVKVKQFLLVFVDIVSVSVATVRYCAWWVDLWSLSDETQKITEQSCFVTGLLELMWKLVITVNWVNFLESILRQMTKWLKGTKFGALWILHKLQSNQYFIIYVTKQWILWFFNDA